MTLNELNEVRNLKNSLSGEEKKLQAIVEVLKSQPHKYGKSEGGGSGGVGKSPYDIYIVWKADTENKIARLQAELAAAIPRLTKKIKIEVTDATEQTLLIYRYIDLKSYRYIAHTLRYSLRHIFRIHERLIKNFTKDVT